jgi:predicted nuclease with TOPRIM domain
MKKILLIGLIAAGVIAFVGVDAVTSALHHARSEIRESITSDVPLKTQLAEAQAQIDAYAESVIRGEVAAENLSEMIGDVAREVRVLETRVERERLALVAMRRGLEVVPTSTATTDEEREAVRRTRLFKAQAQLLDRRQQDLTRLQREHQATLGSIDEAKAEQMRLSEEVHVLAAEIESLEARTSAARTREAVGDSIVSSSGYAEAQQRLKKIRTAVKERNKLLEYYEYERRPVSSAASVLSAEELPTDARSAIDEALAAYPGS